MIMLPLRAVSAPVLTAWQKSRLGMGEASFSVSVFDVDNSVLTE